MKHDLIILYSGGYDSTLLLKMAIQMNYTPLCVIINYGQVHKKEIEYAQEMCKREMVSYTVLDISQSLTVHSKLIDGEARYNNVSQWHVPSRNLIFISFAASIAESEGINLIWYGANYEDRENLFPDCYQEWVFKLNELLKINGSTKIRVEAPLLGMTKETIKSLAKIYGINEILIFSGYGQQ